MKHPGKPVAGPVTRSINVNGIALSYHEWAASPGNDAPTMVFAHATGFHGRTFDAIAEHFAGRRILSLDLRGHGGSEGEPIDNWRIVSDDVITLLDQLEIRGAIGIGHSMGAHTLVQCAADPPNAFSRLVLFDPVILAPEYYEIAEPMFTADRPHPAIRRKRDFASPEAMIERFAPRDPYCLFDPRVFEDYCRYGLTRLDDGSYTLSCSPEMEASVYGSSRSNAGIHDAAAKVKVPTLVVRAKQTELTDFKSSPTWPGLAGIMPMGVDLYRPDRTHFHPFEDPADAARIIAEFEAG